ncbi:MAG: hypothetical protein ACI4O7_05205 [Aristaeellaceae bacterium]
MKRSRKKMILRIVILMTGLTIARFGVTLLPLADMGAEPFSVLLRGLLRTLSRAYRSRPVMPAAGCVIAPGRRAPLISRNALSNRS